jgi:hypothetical protein
VVEMMVDTGVVLVDEKMVDDEFVSVVEGELVEANDVELSSVVT